MTPESTPMLDLADRGELLEEDSGRFLLEIDTETREAEIVFREPLQFHREYFESSGQSWSAVADDAGYLRDPAKAKLIAAVEKVLAEVGIRDVTVEDGSGLEYDDEPSVALTLTTTFSEGETFGSWFDRIGWKVVARMIDVTDPGTFNAPYLFSRIFD